jgi:hypothetical protein
LERAQSRRLNFDDTTYIDFLYGLAMPEPTPRRACEACRWSAAQVESLRQSQIWAAWRMTTGRRKVRLGLGELLDWNLGGRR